MRLGYFADGPWSHEALKKIVSDDRFEIAFITPRYDSQDPVLKEWAKNLGVDFLPIQNVNQRASVDMLKTYAADLFVSMSFNQIIKKDVLEIPPRGFINCHAGALPFYRGRNVLNWVLINDEKEFGVTVHYIDEGIDTGDIIRQRMLPISDKDDYSTLLRVATDNCAELLYDSLDDIERKSVNRIAQYSIHPVGSYYRKRREGDEWIDWNWTSRQIFNFIRAITKPGPCARTILGQQTILLENSSLFSDAPKYIGTAGEIVGQDKNVLIVKTGDSFIKLNGYVIDSIRYISPHTSRQKIRLGDKFASCVNAVPNSLSGEVVDLEKLR